MAGHLLAAGYPLVVHTRTKSRADDLLSCGAVWAQTPAEAARQADVAFICVTDTPDVEKVVLGEGGIIQSARPGLIVVDHSTISPSATRKMADEVAQRGARFLDAPVSGGDVGARNATLSIMVGGDEQAYNAVLPLLQKLGKTVTHCGPSGTGQFTKLANQILVAGTLASVAEAIAFAVKNGLDPAKTISVLSGGAASSWQLANLGPKMAAADFRPGFMIDLMLKDLRLVIQAAQDAKAPLQATAVVQQLFTAAQAAGHGKDGTQAIYDAIRRLGSQP
jgi:3-hydroxyisobutyrate dehydrogenase